MKVTKRILVEVEAEVMVVKKNGFSSAGGPGARVEVVRLPGDLKYVAGNGKAYRNDAALFLPGSDVSFSGANEQWVRENYEPIQPEFTVSVKVRAASQAEAEAKVMVFP